MFWHTRQNYLAITKKKYLAGFYYETFEPRCEIPNPVLNISVNLRNIQPLAQILKPACEICKKLSHQPAKWMTQARNPSPFPAFRFHIWVHPWHIQKKRNLTISDFEIWFMILRLAIPCMSQSG